MPKSIRTHILFSIIVPGHSSINGASSTAGGRTGGIRLAFVLLLVNSLNTFGVACLWS